MPGRYTVTGSVEKTAADHITPDDGTILVDDDERGEVLICRPAEDDAR